MQLQVELQKITEITHLESNTPRTRYHLKLLEVSKKEQTDDWCFEGKTTSRKVNVTFLALKNKETRCALCIYSVNSNKIAIVFM